MKCLIYNVNNFCGKTKTLKSGGMVTKEIKNSILKYIKDEQFQLVALQEFPINHEFGKDFIDEMNSMGYKEFHNNDILNYSSNGTSISIIFVLENGINIIRKVLYHSLRYVCINVNGIDILNVHASLNVNSFTLNSIQQYSISHIGLIFGDFNAGLYLKTKSPALYSEYKGILDNGFTDISMLNGKEQVTNTITNTPIDHVLDKGVVFNSCVVVKEGFSDFSDHLPIILDY